MNSTEKDGNGIISKKLNKTTHEIFKIYIDLILFMKLMKNNYNQVIISLMKWTFFLCFKVLAECLLT